VDLRFYHLPKGHGHHQYWWDNTDGLIGSPAYARLRAGQDLTPAT
jgi:hypothetical protein